MSSLFAASLSFDAVGSGGGMAGWGEHAGGGALLADTVADTVAVADAVGDTAANTDTDITTAAAPKAVNADTAHQQQQEQDTPLLDPGIFSHPAEPRSSTSTSTSYDSWLLSRKVRSPWTEPYPSADDEDVGDSCCFGTRTVDAGRGFVWRLEGGIL